VSSHVEFTKRRLGGGAFDSPANSADPPPHAPQRQVLDERKVQRQSFALPVFGHEPDLRRQLHSTARQRHSSREHAEECVLSGAFDGGDSEDLPGANRERHVLDHRDSALVLHPNVRKARDLAVWRLGRFTGESFLAGVALSFVAGSAVVSKTFVDGTDGCAQDHLAAPQNRDVVGDAEGFAETMRDENDASAAIREILEATRAVPRLPRVRGPPSARRAEA
jgi:hypothetical protein